MIFFGGVGKAPVRSSYFEYLSVACVQAMKPSVALSIFNNYKANGNLKV